MHPRTILILFTCIACGFAQHNDIHKKMTAEELRGVFHVDDHDSVPEYEVVHIHHINTRSIGSTKENFLSNPSKTLSKASEIPLKSFTKKDKDRQSSFQENLNEHARNLKYDQSHLRTDQANIRLTAFGKPLNLSLVKTEGLIKKSGLKVWTVEPNATSQHGVEYVEVPQTNEDIESIYQDTENEAAILLRNDEQNGELLVEGSIGPDLVVRPLPVHLRAQVESDLSDDELYLDNDGEEVSIDTGLPIRRKVTKLSKHIVYKRGPNESDDELGDYEFMQPDRLNKRMRRSTNNRWKREAPYIIYPEILVIVDYDGYRLHGGDNVQIKRYFVSFWNGVDLRYKLLKGPRVRISIAGIIISRGRDATPYLERNRVGRDAIDSAAALTDMGKYLFRERRLPVYDIAVAITKYDMCRRRKGGRCTKGTAGFAYVGGACVVNKRLEKVNSVAIIEDTGGFSGIIVAAHEVGHLLGAVHDGSPPPSYLGGPGAEKCRWEDGYIMSDLRHTDRGFRWSPCSVSSFHHFLNGDTATCLFNAPHEDDSLPRILPGKLLSLDAQCRKDRGTSACFKDDRVCAQLFCFDSGSGYCVAYRPAAEGSPCGDGQYCLNGQCVAEHENIIPDYSQNTPSYIRRQDDNQGRPLFHEDEVTTLEHSTSPPQTPFYYQQFSTTTTTQNTFNLFNQYLSSTTEKTYTPYQYHTPTIKPQKTTQNPYTPSYFANTTPKTTTKYSFFNLFSLSTTKSPYDFQYFKQSTTQKPPSISTKHYFLSNSQSTTKNPYIGDYYNLRSKTTKSPYDFGDFARTTKNYHDNINNNYLKRSYNSASYFNSASNSQNYTTSFFNRQ